jgi:hypothetical protein
MAEIFIPFNTPSSKNSRTWTGRFSIENKRVAQYRKDTKEYFVNNRELFLSMIKGKGKPYLIGFHFVRNNRHKFDFCNMLQIIQDIMVYENYLIDDNCDEMLPVPYLKDGKYYSVDKNNCGTYITVI